MYTALHSALWLRLLTQVFRHKQDPQDLVVPAPLRSIDTRSSRSFTSRAQGRKVKVCLMTQEQRRCRGQLPQILLILEDPPNRPHSYKLSYERHVIPFKKPKCRSGKNLSGELVTRLSFSGEAVPRPPCSCYCFCRSGMTQVGMIRVRSPESLLLSCYM